jgi:uncharacterized UPF0146 family protein
MGSYKHIETCIGRFIASHYSQVIEVGIGNNSHAAALIHKKGIGIRCTDIKDCPVPAGIPFIIDDVFSPDISWYRGADLIYALRPAVEMVPPLITLAKRTGCDLLVYHLGFEAYENGGETVDCGVLLHRYYRASEPVKEG